MILNNVLSNALDRFKDRDLVARHIGMSVGSLEFQAFKREIMVNDIVLEHEANTALSKAEEIKHNAQGTVPNSTRNTQIQTVDFGGGDEEEVSG